MKPDIAQSPPEVLTGDEFNAAEMASLMQASRQETRRLLFDLVPAEKDLRRPPAEGFRPILWHYGHVGAFESYWILQRVKGDASISPRYDLIFDPIKTPKDDSLNLPSIAEIEAYLDRVRGDVLDYLWRLKVDAADPLLGNGYIFRLVLEHEYQHQETLLYLLQLLDPACKRQPDQEGQAESQHPNARMEPAMVRIPGGAFQMGVSSCRFVYDNEQPAHLVELRDFRIDRYPVTNAEYADFLAAGGYRTPALWSAEGWKWKTENHIEQPLYWSLTERSDGTMETPLDWQIREMFEVTALPADHPVTGVSWHEAEAYARFVGKRLPTEAEWEKAASWEPRESRKRRFSWGDELPDASRTNFHNLYWRTTPVQRFPDGQSAYGCMDMTGNVWEWTSGVFDGYAGFQAFPYPEYSQLWFDGDHRVLKGGSWATRAPLLRCSFRNFWRPRFRIAFAGFRCAADG